MALKKKILVFYYNERKFIDRFSDLQPKNVPLASKDYFQNKQVTVNFINLNKYYSFENIFIKFRMLTHKPNS